MKRALLIFSATARFAMLWGCSGQPADDGWRVALEDPDAGRIAICRVDGGDFAYITPDSIVAEGPVTDSTHRTVYFLGYPRGDSAVTNAIYAVSTDGTGLRRVAELPFRALDLQVTPDTTSLVFTGSYPDEERPRAYQMVVGQPGFRAVTPANRPAFDPSMAPGGLNFVWQDSTLGDTLYVSSLQQILTLPIYTFPYTQVTISPDGMAFVAVCGDGRRGLCYEQLQTKEKRVLVAERSTEAVTHPIFHPDGVRVAFVETLPESPTRSSIRVIDINSLENKEIPLDLERPTHPAWVRMPVSAQVD